MAVAAKVEQAGQAMLPIPDCLGSSDQLVHLERHWGELRSTLTSCAPVVGTTAPLSDEDQTEDVGSCPQAAAPRRPAAPQGGARSSHCS